MYAIRSYYGLLAVPKFGNDDDYVDSLVVEGYDSYIDELKKYKNTRYGRGPIGGTYYAGTSSISANVPVITSYSIHYTKLYDLMHAPMVSATHSLGSIESDWRKVALPVSLS